MSTMKNEVVASLKKMTKKQIAEVIGLNVATVASKKDSESKKVMDMIAHMDKEIKTDSSKVLKKDLFDLALDVYRVLKDQFMLHATEKEKVVVENSTKPKLANANKPDGQQPKTDSKKSKSAPKNDIDLATAKEFPDTIKIGDESYALAHDIDSMEKLHEAVTKNEDIVFAYYWTARHLKQFKYAQGTLQAPKSFDNDLDLATLLHVSDEFKVAYALSMYTESLYQIMPNNFEELDGVRFSFGIEFQIYRSTKK